MAVRPGPAWFARRRMRWLRAGMDRDDLARIEAAVASGSAVAEAFASVAAVYEREAVAAEGEGHSLTAREHGWRAALALHFAAVHGGGREARRAARAAYARWAGSFSPPARPCRLAGATAYVRSPAAGGGVPTAVLAPPAGGGKEELRRYEERVLARGLATLSVDGPKGRGRDGWEAWWGRVVEYAGGGSVAVWGVGGATAAVLAAARVPGVVAVAVGDAPARGGRGGPLGRELQAAAAPVAVVPEGTLRQIGLLALGAAPLPGLGGGGDGGGELALDLAADWLVERVQAAGARGEG